MLRKILIAVACLGIGTLFLACQSDDGVAGPVRTQDDAEYYGVAGYCKTQAGVPVNGIVCKVFDEEYHQWFNTGASYTHAIHGPGWYECSTTSQGPFPDEETSLFVDGMQGEYYWGVSVLFNMTTHQATDVEVTRYW